jgi:hypothetical protein
MKISTNAFATLGLAAALCLPGAAVAAGMGEAPTTTLKGEVIDTACYLDRGAKGEKHKQCALNCLNSGIPPGLLTADGKVYLLLPPHGPHDAYDKVKGMAAETVTVKGQVHSEGGLQAMIVSEVE